MAESVPRNLRSWVEDVSLRLDPNLDIFQTNECGHGLQLKNSRPSDNEEKVILEVPSELTLCESRIRELAALDKHLTAWINVDKCKGTTLLHRGLLYLWLCKKDSMWSSYLEALPTQIDLPFSYSIKNMEGLDFASVSLSHAAMSKRLEIERSYERFVNSPVYKTGPPITLEQWLLPHQWISSRGLKHPVTDETCLVPIVDLCNHSSTRSNCRYDVDTEGNFQLLLLPTVNANRLPEETFELYLDYGTRSSAEFMFNYGFVPEERSEGDFDEVIRFFDPNVDDIRDLLDPGRSATDVDDSARYELSLAYEVLLEFFSESTMQCLRIIRLPKSIEPDESKRYRFHSHFVMAIASEQELELRQDEEEGGALFLGGREINPNNVFEAVMAYGDPKVLDKARKLVARMCLIFARQISQVTDNGSLMISKLAQREAAIYKQYAANIMASSEILASGAECIGYTSRSITTPGGTPVSTLEGTPHHSSAVSMDAPPLIGTPVPSLPLVVTPPLDSSTLPSERPRNAFGHRLEPDKRSPTPV